VIQEITEKLHELIDSFPPDDEILFNNTPLPIDQRNFTPLAPKTGKSIAFVDGGQAEILSASNFCLSFIRIFSVTFRGRQKISSQKYECYLLTTCEYRDTTLFYRSTLFSEQGKLIDENDLQFSATDPLLRTGNRKCAINKIANIARRFAELSLAAQCQADYVVLDGTLEISYPHEEKYRERLGDNVSALAKTTDIVTVHGNNPSLLLHHPGCWRYIINEQVCFVKLHEQSEYIFRFEGNREVLPYLLTHSTDPVFLGYPYGLLYADRYARVSQKENDMMKLQCVIKNDRLRTYLHSQDAHDILDTMS
jgi:hypothetical protein